MGKMRTYDPSTPRIITSSISPVVFSELKKANYELSVAIAYVKNHLSDFVQVAFLEDQEAQNEFAWQTENFKHRFTAVPNSFLKTSRRLIIRS
jgi:hypothetical protein